MYREKPVAVGVPAPDCASPMLFTPEFAELVERSLNAGADLVECRHGKDGDTCFTAKRRSSQDDDGAPAIAKQRTEPEIDILVEINGTGEKVPYRVGFDTPLENQVFEADQGGAILLLDGDYVAKQTPRQLKLVNGSRLDLMYGQTGGFGEVSGDNGEAMVAAAGAPDEGEAMVAAPNQHPQPTVGAAAAIFPQLLALGDHEWQHVHVPDEPFMPPLRGTTVMHTPPGATEAVEIDIEPKPSTQNSCGNVVLASPWMGGGKSTAKQELQKVLIRECPHRCILDVDCNRIYSINNGVSLKETAKALRAEGLNYVKAASYLDRNILKGEAPLSSYQMVGCSFESLFKLRGDRFGLVTLDEISALALKIGGGTMPHFECVHVLKSLLAQLGTRVLALDAAAHFKMSDTEPRTVVEDFLRLVAPQRQVLTVALDPANMPPHLRRRLRCYYGTCKKQVELFWKQVEGAIAAWQADNSLLIKFVVGTPAIGRKEVSTRLKEMGVPHRFYHGESNQNTRFRDLADPGSHWASLGAVWFTTVVGRGVDLPPTLRVSRVFVVMDRCGCDFGEMFQAMLRARHVEIPTIEVLLARTMPPEQREKLVLAGKRKPIERPTYESMLKLEKLRRGMALRATERQARAVNDRGSATTPASNDLLNVMAHARLNRQMQLVDPVFVVQKYATYYGMPIETEAPPPAQAAEAGAYQLDEDEAFDVNASDEEKWAIVARTIRERGEHGFFNDKCWGLANDEMKKSNTLTALEQWLIKAYHALKHIGAMPELPNREQPDSDSTSGGEGGGGEEDNGEKDGGVEEDAGEEDGGEEDAGEEDGGEEEDAGSESDPAAELLHAWLGNGSDQQSLTKALNLQARCLVSTPEEQMRQEQAFKLELGLSGGRPISHEHCEYGLGQNMMLVLDFGKELRRGGFSHVRQVFDEDNGIVNNANIELVRAANNQKLNEMTEEDQGKLRRLQQIASQLNAAGKRSTFIDVLKSIGNAMGLELKYKTEYLRQSDGTRKNLVKIDPGLRFERVLPKEVDQWLIRSTAHDAKVSVADWPHAHAELQLEQSDYRMAADDHDYGNLFSAAFRRPVDGDGAPNKRVELIPDGALQAERRRLKAQYELGKWMDGVPPRRRVEWGGQQRARFRRHLQTTNALRVANAIDRDADPPDERGLRVLHVFYGKNSIDIGRRTASAPSMQNCPSALRRVLCRALYHDIDIVSCHPTLMLQVVRKMVAAGALQWSDSLNKLVEYAELDANGVPVGRMPMLLRIAHHFGIDQSVAKDVCKMLVLRVLNGGQVAAWCREMSIDVPAEEQADLRDLAEVARIVREAFFAMLERDRPGALQTLRDRVWATLKDKHQHQVRDAQQKGEPPPQPPSIAQRDRTLFSHCIFDLEDRVLDCIDSTLRGLGWTVASLIYDGVHVEHREGFDLTTALRAAEAAVNERLGYTIALLEKPLYAPDGA